MRNLILLLVLLMSLSLIAQDTENVNSVDVNGQAEVWMSRISTDSEMRVIMMDMIIENIQGNELEMAKIVQSISNDPELHEMIIIAYPEKANSQNISINPIGFDKDSIKVGVTLSTPRVPKPKQ
jgi:hypothetical protein